MDSTYRGVSGWEGVVGVGGSGGVVRMGGSEGGWVGSQKQVIPSNWTVWSSYESKNC